MNMDPVRNHARAGAPEGPLGRAVSNGVDGLQRCVRYAFGPNRLHLCGPDANKEILSYITQQDPNAGLISLLKRFKTMFPYLQSIARANHIADPFDDRVVEAYWLGNELLENIGKKDLYKHLLETGVNKKSSPEDFDVLKNKLAGVYPVRNFISNGARMHHAFHVYNIWKNRKDFMELKTFDDVDHCRVSWGRVTAIDGPMLTVAVKPLIFNERSGFIFGPDVEKKIVRKLNDDIMIEAKIDDIISVHWDMPCEILTPRQVSNLEKYTKICVEQFRL